MFQFDLQRKPVNKSDTISLIRNRSNSTSSNSLESGTAVGQKRRRQGSFANIRGPPTEAAFQIFDKILPQVKDASDDHVRGVSSFYTHSISTEHPQGLSTDASNRTEDCKMSCLISSSPGQREDVMMIHEFSSLVDLAFLPLPPL